MNTYKIKWHGNDGTTLKTVDVHATNIVEALAIFEDCYCVAIHAYREDGDEVQLTEYEVYEYVLAIS